MICGHATSAGYRSILQAVSEARDQSWIAANARGEESINIDPNLPNLLADSISD